MPDREKLASGLTEAYEKIRSAVLRGDIAPGTRLSQVKMAERFGLSRTPVREALRMMEKEGLVRAQHGRQVVIAPTSMADLDELYALRINLDTATSRVTVPILTEQDLQEMQACLDAMVSYEDLGSFDEFDREHRQFHMIAIRAAGERHVSHSSRLNEHAERYRRLYLAQPSSWQQSRSEHAAIMLACRERDGEQVAHLLAEHYARIALTIVAQIEPGFEPWLVRAAVRSALTGSNASGSSRKDAMERKAGRPGLGGLK